MLQSLKIPFCVTCLALALASPALGQSPSSLAARDIDLVMDGWSVVETANFRIFHHQSDRLAEKSGRIAELTRRVAEHKWFGTVSGNWCPRCQLYLYPTRQEFSRATGVPVNVPGHSSTRCEGERVLSRRIDLQVNRKDALLAVLPHEVTHIVMAGKFGGRSVSPWANEGMAVLSEPPDVIHRHLVNLARYQRNGRLLSARQLLRLSDYPDGHRLGPFYAQSVSLVQFLTHEKGPRIFTRFLRDALQRDYQTALARYYEWDFDEFEWLWKQHAFAEHAQTDGSVESVSSRRRPESFWMLAPPARWR